MRARDALDNVIAQMAWQNHKQALAEFPIYSDIRLDFIGMSDQVAHEHLELLLDYLDDEESGRLSDRFGWIFGRTSSRTLDRMRATNPAVYEYEHVRRNTTWVCASIIFFHSVERAWWLSG